jgi:hypothetical protein
MQHNQVKVEQHRHRNDSSRTSSNTDSEDLECMVITEDQAIQDAK